MGRNVASIRAVRGRQPLRWLPLVGLFAWSAVAQPLSFGPIQQLPGPAEPFKRVEFAFAISNFTGNPFDPLAIDVKAEFTGPSGQTRTVPAFWFQPFARELFFGSEFIYPDGSPGWRVRFAADQPGQWQVRFHARDHLNREDARTNFFAITNAATPSAGFARVHSNRRNFVTDDGRPYVPIGLNVCWFTSLERGTQDYEQWFPLLSTNGGNYARIWLARDRSLGFWATNTSTTNFTPRLDRAWRMDRILELAEQNDIRLIPTLLIHRQFRTGTNGEWADNPYNITNGGYLTSPSQLFTNAQAAQDMRLYFRYVVARWGYSPSILAWEIFNEVSYVDNYDAIAGRVRDWHNEMAAYLKSVDAFAHPVTSSSARPLDTNLFAATQLDFLALHDYWDSPRWQEKMANLQRQVRTNYNRPVLFEEMGYEFRSGELSAQRDPDGIHVHAGLWTGLMTGGMGTGMSWWWESYFFPRQFEKKFGPLRQFANAVPWLDADLRLAGTNEIGFSTNTLAGYGYLKTNAAYFWISDPSYDPGSPAPRVFPNVTVTLPLPAGDYRVIWTDTRTGQRVRTLRHTAPASPVVLAAPAFTNDIAFSVEALPAVPVPVLHYRFDDATNAFFAADTGRAPQTNGLFNGSATRTSAGQTPSGAGRALNVNFPGATNYLRAGNPAKLNGLAQITLTAWLNLRDVPAGNDRILSKLSASAGFDFKLFDATTNVLPSIHINTTATSAQPTNRVNAFNRWVFLAVTYDAGVTNGAARFYAGSTNEAVYLLGAVDKPAGFGGPTILDTPNEFRVGSTAATTQDRTPPAWLDDVRVYDLALTAAELEQVRLLGLNQPPTAPDIGVAVLQGGAITFNLLAAAPAPTDADGDALSVLSVAPVAPANGGTATTDGSNVTYTASAAFTGTDVLSYSVGDGRGGSASGQILVAVIAPGDAPTVTGVAATNGSVALTAQGLAGAVYQLQFTGSLAPANWQNVGAPVPAPPGGIVTLTDPAPPTGQRFYRLRHVSGP